MHANLSQIDKARQIKKEADELLDQAERYKSKLDAAEGAEKDRLKEMIRDMLDRTRRLYKISEDMVS